MLQTLELHEGDAARASIVVLHGLGADGTDFLSLADEMDLDALRPLRWVFPRAPLRPVTINGGREMRAWYDVVDDDLHRHEDEAGLRASIAAVHALLDREIARGMAAERIVLAGFSQGCALTLGAGLRFRQRLAGLVGLSGRLPLPSSTASERSDANRRTPVFIAHGESDPVVPLARGQEARDTLLADGHPVQWHSYPMKHGMCLHELRDLQRWLLQVLA